MPRWRNGSGQRIRLDNGARMNDTACCCDEETTCCANALVTIEGMANDGCDNCTDINATHVVPLTAKAADCGCVGGDIFYYEGELICGQLGVSTTTWWTVYVELDCTDGYYLFVDLVVTTGFIFTPFPVSRSQRWSITLPGYPFCDGREYELTLEAESGSSAIQCDMSGVSVTIAFN